MAVMEHAYYGSFGYHVTSFLAPSSRFGTPEDLKFLVDAAHGLGLLIIMDCVHSHASKNAVDGLNELDGTDFQYFHAGEKGAHALWDSRLFDYAKLETQRLLLSSLRLFVDEFRFDGFRFDGVTSMMYAHHGLGVGFSGHYDEYFSAATDLDAVNYLQLANTLLHSLDPPALSIAEDVSGMPTLGRPVWEGGVGFDYRLSMAIPDIWIKLLKEKRDEDWNLDEIAFTLVNRRHQEKCIAYAESHDQALVGDKTIAFWLMDKDMYWHMAKAEAPRHVAIDRGLALHKMIRLLTYALGGEGWLNFMGNEFGHPEWVDFPTARNEWSYHYCRRQWSLADNPALLYGGLALFDARMHALEARFPWLESRDEFVSTKDNADKVLAFDRGTPRGALVFAFNFNGAQSFTNYRVGVPAAGTWAVALDSDAAEFDGYARVDRGARFVAQDFKHHGRDFSVQLYLPARTVLVLERVA
jgi:1,4-alpha-glucan branching enzyme